MPVIDYSILWAIFKTFFNLVVSVLAMLGLGEWGGRVMAVLLFATLFFLAGAFKKTRKIIGPLLALAIMIVALLGYI